MFRMLRIGPSFGCNVEDNPRMRNGLEMSRLTYPHVAKHIDFIGFHVSALVSLLY